MQRRHKDAKSDKNPTKRKIMCGVTGSSLVCDVNSGHGFPHTDENWFTLTLPRPALEKESIETRDKIIKLIKKRPEITIKEMADEVGITPKGIEWQISKLKKQNRIKRVGSTKSGHWDIINNAD